MTNPYTSPTPSNAPQFPPGQPPYDATAQGQTQYMQTPYAQQSAPQGQAWGYGTQPQNGPYGSPTPPANVYGAQQAQWTTGPAAQIASDGTACLVLGVLGFILIGPFGSVPAWIWGTSLVRKAQALGMPDGTYSTAKIGKILGIVGTIIWGFALLIPLVMFIIFLITAPLLTN